MADPFVGEIRIVGFNFAPRGWATCDGQLLPISQNTALFSLLGTFYGGDGKSTFALPNLQGSAPLAQGQGQGLSEYVIGQQGGTANVTLLPTEIPAHNHGLMAFTDPADLKLPANHSLARSSNGPAYTAPANFSTASPIALGVMGANAPHNNMQPYLTMLFIIAMQGIFPPRQ
ncbi:MAG TPA: tail fiber protein [Bryobacteraceae bacterium]|nr:tail fiber protein [Bryobacteraceae bacterium]